jgi:hypothetical protein
VAPGAEDVSDRRVSWRDRFGDEVTCVRCLEVRDTVEVDRLLWCERCRTRARARAARRGWLVGVTGALLLALWIWLVVRPSNLVPGGWLATIVAAAWIGAKVAREVLYGLERFRNRRAAEAVPPVEGDPPAPHADP